MAKVAKTVTVASSIVALLFIGCGDSGESEAATPEMNRPEPISEPAETPAESEPTAEPTETWDESVNETEAITLDAEELVNERCTFCHYVDRVYKAGLSAASWEETIDRMIARGTWLAETEREAVIEYLVNL
jgi:hypothetical protein